MDDKMLNRILEMTIAIQQISAPTFEEGERAAFMQARFQELGLQNVGMDEAGNVLACLPGGNAKPLVMSAHLDTVFLGGTDLTLKRDEGRIYGPGVGDNSMGLAALFGVLWNLKSRGLKLPGDLWLVANTGEEGLGDLRGMKSVVQRFGEAVTCYLVVEGAALGRVYHRAVGVQRYRISAQTAGGHAWSDYGQPSAVHELAGLTAQIASLGLPVSPRTTLNVGKISGGTSINVVAAQASLELDMRSESPQSLVDLVGKVDALIRAANKPGVLVEAESIGQRPAGSIPADHPLIQLALECTRAQGVDATLIGGSTDANIPLSRGMPALVMGVTTGGGAHTIGEYIDVEPVGRGMQALVDFVEKVFAL
jgi:acetylornithine deacetylase/succinyl-diaminopimelate desuccinylase-like protein